MHISSTSTQSAGGDVPAEGEMCRVSLIANKGDVDRDAGAEEFKEDAKQ
jgi:hypothetical protein